ncbi:hypothetical protein [Longibacter salinarum]|uniref:hypothetical protein n=1 Tax=Longibacter salinarum TaxID=1850348 RepID=UPI00117E3171|nr:hypothetical protein [Longibacter salinarum]
MKRASSFVVLLAFLLASLTFTACDANSLTGPQENQAETEYVLSNDPPNTEPETGHNTGCPEGDPECD